METKMCQFCGGHPEEIVEGASGLKILVCPVVPKDKVYFLNSNLLRLAP